MTTSAARGFDRDAPAEDSPLRDVFCARTENGSLRPHNWDYDAAHRTDTDKNDRLNFDTPSVLDATLASKLRRIADLIERFEAVDAINLALDILRDYPDLPEREFTEVTSKIAEALPSLGVNGRDGAARNTRLRLLADSNLSSQWEPALLGLDTTGLAFVMRGLRDLNSSDIEIDDEVSHSFPLISLHPAA